MYEQLFHPDKPVETFLLPRWGEGVLTNAYT